MSKIIMTTDPHFTDLDRDAHRFDLFRQIKEIGKKHKCNRVFLLGDVLDKKDNHPGKLVNQVVSGLVDWAETFEEVIIVHGNHDSLDASTPFLQFLNRYPGIHYISDVTLGLEWGDPFLDQCVFLPHSRTPLRDWEYLDLTDKIVFAHVTVNGALAESMIKLESQVEPSFFDKAKLVFSGDIHKGQTVGPVNYVGSPYDTRFNPVSYEGTCIVLDTETLRWERIPLDFPRRIVFDVRSYKEYEKQLKASFKTTPRSQIKVRLHVDKDNLKTHKEDYRKIQESFYKRDELAQYELVGIEIINEYKQAVDVKFSERKFTDFDSWCDKKSLPSELITVGREIMKVRNETA